MPVPTISALTSPQPERRPEDGPVAVTRDGAHIEITATTHGVTSTLAVTEFNAWRLFAMLALILGVSLPKKLLQSIRM
jgi:hypothetical protein